MRIALVSNEFAPFHGAGIGTYASLMAAAWHSAGHEIHIFTGPHAGVLEEGPRLRPGVWFHLVDPGGGPGRAGIGTASERYALGVLGVLERLHDDRVFDYIEFPDYGGEGAAAMWARRTVGAFPEAVLGVRLHTPRRECREINRESWLDEEGARADALEDAAIRMADILISPSASLMEMVRKRLGGGARWPKEAVVPYPFDQSAVAELLPEGGGAAARDSEGPPTVLYFGRLERRKGVELLVTAARRILDSGTTARFRFIGGDTPTGPAGASMRAHLEALAGPHAGHGITFEPPRPRRDLGHEIARATLICIPSLWENFPNVVLESMAMGAAVIGSDAGGIGEIIRDRRDGLLFRAGDAADLERVLREALADEALRRSIAAAAPVRIQELCDPAAVVARTIQAVESARAPVSIPMIDPARACPSVSIAVIGDPEDPGIEQTQRSAEAAGVLECSLIPVEGSAVASALRGLRGEWVLPITPGDVIERAGLERLLAAAHLNPGAAWIGGLGASLGGAGPAPVGLDRDLLAAGQSPGPALVRRNAIEPAGSDEALTGPDSALWALACRLAGKGERWVVAPWVVVRRPEGRGIVPQSAVMSMIERNPGLAADPGRVMRILAARSGTSRPSTPTGTAEPEPPPGPRREIHTEAVFRQRLMEENLRYRVADRVSAALRATGIQRPIKALLGLAQRVRRGIAGRTN
jgi:glycosyltransferase involved in cell wall biosynthesis